MQNAFSKTKQRILFLWIKSRLKWAPSTTKHEHQTIRIDFDILVTHIRNWKPRQSTVLSNKDCVQV